MEGIKSLSTGVHSVPGYAVVHYRLLTVLPRNSLDTGPSERELLDIAEAGLLEQGQLAVKDIDTGCVWLFQNKHKGELVTEIPQDPDHPQVERVALSVVFQGLLKLQDLPKARMRAAMAASGRSPITPIAPSLNTQILNAKAVWANAGNAKATGGDLPKFAEFDPSLVLPWFIAAVETCVSYILASRSNFIPLNARTWAVTPSTNESATPADGGDDKTTTLISLNAYISTAGILILSFVSSPRPDIFCVGTNIQNVPRSKSIVWVAPNGCLAELIIHGDNDITISPSKSKRRAVASKNQFHGLSWKASVTKWLSHRGILVDTSQWWVDIQIDQDIASGTSAKNKPIQCSWPASLCFAFTAASQVDSLDPSATGQGGIQWFSMSNDAYTDPFQDAQDWFVGKDERERRSEAIQKAAATQQEQIMAADAGILPTSPFYTRPDLQATGGVYPTPPDGIPTQLTMATQPGDTPYAAPSTVDTQAMESTPSAPLPVTIVETNAEPTSPLDEDKDLFGDVDMDEDGLVGNELSDADFNFFDEPDETPAADVEMSGVLPSDVSAQEAGTVQPDADNPATQGHRVGPQAMSADADEASNVIESAPAEPLTQSEITSLVAETPLEAAATVPALDPVLDRRQIFQKEKANDLDPQRLSNVRFHDEVTALDSKYTTGGMFDYNPPGQEDSGTLPTDRRPSNSALLDASRPHTGSHPDPRRRNFSLTGIEQLGILAESDTDESSSMTSADDFTCWTDGEQSEDELGSETKARKRMRPDDDLSSTDSTPMHSEAEDEMQLPNVDYLALSIQEEELISLFEPDNADWDLAQFPAPALGQSGNDVSRATHLLGLDDSQHRSTGRKATTRSTGEAYISIAQVVVEQSALNTLRIPHAIFSVSDKVVDVACEARGDCELPSGITQALSAVFPNIVQLDLARYAYVQDATFEPPPGAKAPARPPVRKGTSGPGGVDAPSPNALFAINPQHVRVRRGEALWDLLPTALPFWETLGLGPASGAKNILVYCIHPDNEALVDPLNGFLDAVGTAYEGCKLGTHQRGPRLLEAENGLLPVRLDSSSIPNYESARAALSQMSSSLGDALAQLAKNEFGNAAMKADEPASKVNSIVLYTVDSFETSKSLRDLCTFFWHLFEAYALACQSISWLDRKPDLVLKIVPISCITRMDAPVYLHQKALAALAREIYDRCPPNPDSSSNSTLSIQAAPSIQLEETVPRAIPFRLTNDPSAELLHDCSHLHLGYAMSWDGNWITAAWTDGFGKYQTTVSYNMIQRTFGEIAKEIWQTTLAIMQARKVTWRVTIARAGVMDREELEAWASLVSGACPMPVGAVLMTIDTNPSLQLTRSLPQPVADTTTMTPASTPQGVSPSDPTTNAAATPSDALQDTSNDPNAHLVDVTDEIWGVILGHRLNNSNSLTEVRPCLASGFLVNKGADAAVAGGQENADDAQDPQCTGYNIVWIGSSARQPAHVQPQTPMTPGAQAAASSAAAFAQGIAASAAQQQQQQQQSASPATPVSGGSGVAAAGATPRFGGATIEPILKEYLTLYRGLGMLARLRGLRGTRGGTAPWHVVVALAGVNALMGCMDE